MAPKKSSPFMTFVMEIKNKPGGRGLSLKQAMERADPLWKAMTEKERQAYIGKAKDAPAPASKCKAKSEPLNCLGKPISYVERELEEAERKGTLMKNSIASTVRTAVEKGELEATTFVFISVNYFVSSREGDIYVPAEISLTEFSLNHGVQRTFHTLVNPGSMTYGYLYDAQQHSESTHNLPLPPKAMGEKDLSAVYDSILDFIKDGSGAYAPVYTPADNIATVEAVFRYLEMHSTEAKVDIKVYSIQHLLFVMKDETAQIGEMERPASHFATDDYFLTDPFEYQSGIACDFHEEIDRTKYCTKSHVIRWGFMFADLMCNDVAVKPIPGRHCPNHTDVSYLVEPPKEKKERWSRDDDDDDDKAWHTVGKSASHSTSRDSNHYYGRGGSRGRYH